MCIRDRASGGLLGVGLGRGMPEVIPVRSSDYIFAVIGEEFGIIIGIFVIIFYLVFIVRGILIALDARSTYDALLVFGCTAMLSLQSFIIIGGVITVSYTHLDVYQRQALPLEPELRLRNGGQINYVDL